MSMEIFIFFSPTDEHVHCSFSSSVWDKCLEAVFIRYWYTVTPGRWGLFYAWRIAILQRWKVDLAHAEHSNPYKPHFSPWYSFFLFSGQPNQLQSQARALWAKRMEHLTAHSPCRVSVFIWSVVWSLARLLGLRKNCFCLGGTEDAVEGLPALPCAERAPWDFTSSVEGFPVCFENMKWEEAALLSSTGYAAA